MSTYKDFCIFVDKQTFGIDRDELLERLALSGIQTKRYFYPPVHQPSVAKPVFASVHLPNTDLKASRVLALPMYSHMPFEDVEFVCRAVERTGMGGAAA